MYHQYLMLKLTKKLQKNLTRNSVIICSVQHPGDNNQQIHHDRPSNHLPEVFSHIIGRYKQFDGDSKGMLIMNNYAFLMLMAVVVQNCTK